MLLRNMVADGYYPNLIVDPMWYEPKHPQEALPSLKDPVSLFRPAPDRDNVSALLLLGGAEDPDEVPDGGFGMPSGGSFSPSQVSIGFEIGGVSLTSVPIANHQWDQDSAATPEPDTGVGPAGPFDMDYLSTPTPQEPSLRADSTGFAIEYTGGARAQNFIAPITYDNGFTIEYAILPTIIGSRSVTGGVSRIVQSVHAHNNQANWSIFELGFDNWNNPGGSTDLTPCFVLMSDQGGNYDTIAERGLMHFLGEARSLGDTLNAANLGTKIYHLCGTLSLTGTAKLYVNGVEKDSFSVDMDEFVAPTGFDLGDGARLNRRYFNIGTRFLAGAWRGSSNSGEATIDEVRFYGQELTASEVAAKAALINFT